MELFPMSFNASFMPINIGKRYITTRLRWGVRVTRPGSPTPGFCRRQLLTPFAAIQVGW